MSELTESHILGMKPGRRPFWHLWVILCGLFALSLGCATLSDELAQLAIQATEPTPLPATAAPIVTATVPALLNEGVRDLQAQVEAVYVTTGDSVVNLAVTTIAYDFFRNPIAREGSGSGFVYDSAGHIVTNYHVVEGAAEIDVTFADGTTLVAELVGQAPTYDLAVVRVDPTAYPLTPVTLGDSESLRIGQFVVAIGAPFGLEQSLTFGVISSLGRIIDSPDNRYIGEAIQTDAAINPGNSGGPLLDLEGRVIGVNAQIISPSRASAGIGFAIPVQTVKRVIPELIATGTYRHSWMGVAPVTLTQPLADILRQAGYEVPDRGVYLATVEPGFPAAAAGLRGPQREVRTNRGLIPVGGDVIVALNGTPVLTERDFVAYLETYTQPGDLIEVQFVREGQMSTVQVVLGERPSR